MSQTPTRPWDAAEHIETDEDAAAYMDAARDDGDESLILAVQGDVARARRMRALAGQSEPDNGAE